MKEYKYHYVVSKENSSTEFKRACEAIECTLRNIKKWKLAIDVDGTTVQAYTVEGNNIIVIDSYDYGYVFVDSDVDLSAIFN